MTFLSDLNKETYLFLMKNNLIITFSVFFKKIFYRVMCMGDLDIQVVADPAILIQDRDIPILVTATILTFHHVSVLVFNTHNDLHMLFNCLFYTKYV